MNAVWLRGWCVVLFLVAIQGCVPKRVSAECQRRISACMENCPTDPPPSPAFENASGLNDSRNTCERACQEQCK